MRIAAIFLLLMGWWAPFELGAQSFSVVLGSESVELGDSTQLELRFEGLSVNAIPRLPAIPNATVQAADSSVQEIITNGSRRSIRSFRYVLTPRAVGEIEIPALQFQASGKTYTSQPVRLTVLKSNTTPLPAGVDKNLFMRLITPTNDVAYGESFPIEIKLYFLKQVTQASPPRLELDGFIQGKVAKAESGNVRIGGEPYSVVSWKMSLTSVKSGDLFVGPAECDAVVSVQSQRRNDFFGGLFSEFFNESKQVHVRSGSNQVRVVVPPAEGRPAGYDGAVGCFQLSGQISGTNVTVGEPVTLNLKIAGRGNLESLVAPKIPEVPGLKVYDPQSEVQSTDPLGMEGAKSFVFRIVPESTNVVAIPEIRMSVYDPAQKKYTSLTYPSTTLTVRPGIDTEPQAAFFTNSAGKSLAPASSTSEGQFPLRLTLGSSASAAPWIASLWFRLGFAFPLVAWIGIGVGRIVFVRWRNDPERMRRRNLARSIADARAQLDESIRTNDSREIVDSLQAVLAREMNAIVSLPPGSITAQNVRNALSSSGVESGHLDEIEEIMITLENTRFAPSMGKIDLLSLRSRMDSAIVGVKGAVDL